MANQPIQGVLRDEASGEPGRDLLVVAWDTGGMLDRPIGEVRSGEKGTFDIPLDDRLRKLLVTRRLRVFFRVHRGDVLVGDSRRGALWDPQDPRRVVVPVSIDAEPVDAAGAEVGGRVVTERGTAAAGLRVVAVDRGLRGETVLGEDVTDARGMYAIGYDPEQLGRKRLADIQVRVVSDDGADLVRSKVAYEAPAQAVVDLEVPFSRVGRAGEHDRMAEALAPLLDDVPLEQVDPDGVMFLANRGAWDPRAVAMAVQAERAAATTRIPAAHYYALFRTGAAGDRDSAHRLTDERLVQALEEAVASGVISDGHSIDQTLELHRVAARTAMREFVPDGGVSSVDELLSIHLDEEQKDLFVDRLRATQGEPAALWDSLIEAGMDEGVVKRLRTDGKLGYLTRHNAPVMRRLVETARVESTADLVTAGLYEPKAWSQLVERDVPVGLTAEAYRVGLAAQVRQAHPTLVVSDLVRKGAVAVGSQQATKAVADFLAGGEGAHRIGATPVRTWAGFDALAPGVQQGVLLVERLHQLSPSDASMRALSDIGVDSARDVVRYSETEFLDKHGEEFPSRHEARLVSRKAQEVHSTLLNLVTTYLTQRALPPMLVLGGGDLPNPTLDDSVPAKATLETLFGNLDLCACEHCRSVLSPAAYLVELLEMLDLAEVPHDGANPLDVLLGRRPDLQHILLSCENTNVALPYVDLVIEVLEHYVVNGDLDEFTGHDTVPGASSADLLVDPAYVEAAAYTPLAASVFPAPLPFDMPLEALRLQFQAWDATLADALDLFGVPADARRERLGLNAAELSMLTDTTFRALPEYFGEPAGASMDDLNAAIANAKVFARRVDVTHMELHSILRTRFVNPGVVLVPLLVALHVGLDEIQSWFDGAMTDQQLLDQLPDDLDPTPYDGDVLEWLTANRPQLMGLITLWPTGDADPDVDQCDFGLLELRLSLPDPDANALTALEYHRLHRFVRLWRALRRVLGADIEETDELLVTLLPTAPEDLTPANLDAACTTLVARLANFVRVLDERGVSKKARRTWLALADPALDTAARAEHLARLLKLGAIDFANLVAITGVDPLAADLESDTPSLLRFLRVAEDLAASPLKVDDVDFLVRDGDPGGTRVPSPEQLRADLRTLRTALATVEATLGAPSSAADLGLAQARMALVYDPGVVAQFFGLLTGTTTYRAALVTVEEALPDKITAATTATTATAATQAIGFDPFTDELTFEGTMTTATRDALHAAADDLDLDDVEVIDTQVALDAFVADLKAAVTALHTAGADDVAGLQTEHPELGAVLDAALAAPDPAAQAAAIVNGILPELRARLKATALRTTLVTVLRADEPLVATLTSGPDVLHADGDPGRGVLDDLLGLDAPVVFDHDAVFEAYVDPPAGDDYLLYVQAPPGTQVTLRVDGTTVIPVGPVGGGGEVVGVAALTFQAAVPALVELTLAGLPADRAARLLWRTKSLAKEPVPAARLTAQPAAVTAGLSLLRLRKAAQLAGGLGLTARELAFAASASPDSRGILDDLPVGGPPLAADVPPLWAKLAPLAWFAAWKRDTEPEADTWVDVLESAALGDATGQARVATIGSWRPADVTDAVALLGAAGDDLQRLTTLRVVARIAEFAVATGQTVAQLQDWAVPDPDVPLITEIRDAVRAALDAEAWRESMRSVNDALRNLRRDALVAYILAHVPPTPAIETADELYEHFLVDVQMDACMQTSRIRLALSTVQLFVTRCLLGLEDDVSPGSIRRDHWAWMSRYRVWEANRKIFLWPENWLEPELRDGKSPFFRELESDLLKADITTELAEDSFLAYLKKLDDIARLEIIGCHLQPGVPGKTEDDILHVIGRTNGKTRQHWYRRFEYGYWTPWEKISLNIDGDLVFPTMWRNQLYLFWVTVVEKPRGGNQDNASAAFANQTWQPRSRIDVELTLNWGELYRGKWTSPKSTNMRKPLVIRGLLGFHLESLLLFARTEKPAGSSERLVFSVIYLHEDDVKAFKLVFTSKNASPIVFEDDPDFQLRNSVAEFYQQLYWERQLESTLDGNSLDVPRTDLTLRIAQPASATSSYVDETLLTKKSGLPGWDLSTVMHPVENQWEAPFFCSDERSTFHVQPDERHVNFVVVDTYVPIGVGKVEIEIPDIYEEVVTVNPRDPIWNPEWMAVVNPRITNVLGGTVVFELDGTAIGPQGLLR